MRTSRLLLGGTVIVALSAGLSGTALAQDAGPAAPAIVTGSESCTMVQMGTKTVSPDEAGVIRFRDHVTDCLHETSDPRVTGVFRNTFNEDCYPVTGGSEAACVVWGTNVLEGEDGGWDCAYLGTDRQWHPKAPLILAVCPGNGEYDGLTYIIRVFGEAPSFPSGTDTLGVIYEGPAPVLGPVPELPS